MKKNLLLGSLALMAASLLAADTNPKADITAAAKKLADTGNYSWKLTLDLGPNSQYKPGPTEGKTDKDGCTWLSSSFQDNAVEGVVKDKKVAVKTEGVWKSAEEATGGGGGFNLATFMARRLQNFKPPAAEIEDLVSKAKDFKKDGDLYSGDLTEEGAQSLLTMGFGRRGGAQPPPATEAKGALKFWIKDGAVTRYEIKVSGKRDFNGEVRNLERTSTIELKDVGTTKVEVPAAAKSKLS